MEGVQITNRFIPQLWSDMVTESLTQGLYLSVEQWKAETAAHEQRMVTDPGYARAYEEEEAESYWLALYENQLPEQEEEEW